MTMSACRELMAVIRRSLWDAPKFVISSMRCSGPATNAKLPLRIDAVVECGQAVRQRLAAAEEVVEVALDRHVDRVADRGSARVEVDENRPSVTRKREREVDRERRFADAAFAGRDRDDPFDSHFSPGSCLNNC
jgi:hypothetical protein